MKTAILKDGRRSTAITLQNISIGLFRLIYVEVLITVTLLAVTSSTSHASQFLNIEVWAHTDSVTDWVIILRLALGRTVNRTPQSFITASEISGDFKDLSICISVVVNNRGDQATNTNRIWYAGRRLMVPVSLCVAFHLQKNICRCKILTRWFLQGNIF